MRAIVEDGGVTANDTLRQPEQVEAAFERGVNAYLRRDYATALEHFERALRLQPDHALSRNNVGVIRARLGIA